MNYVFDPEPRVTVPVAGSDAAFPVRRVDCVRRNDAAHARELGFDPDREPPFFFCKPDNAIVVVPERQTVKVPYPRRRASTTTRSSSSRAIGTARRDIPVARANEHVDLIFTGTPEGVGAVQRGQTLRGGIDALGELRVKVV